MAHKEGDQLSLREAAAKPEKRDGEGRGEAKDVAPACI